MMPEINLNLECVGKLVQTPNQEEYDKLMQICEAGGWRWLDGTLPTDYPNKIVSEETYIIACDKFRQLNHLDLYHKFSRIDVKQFCKYQDLGPSELEEISKFFSENKPQRGSLGESLGVGVQNERA